MFNAAPTSRSAAAATILVLATGGPAAPAERIGSPASAEQFLLVPPAYEPQDTFGASLTVQTVRIEQITPPSSAVTYATVINATSVYRHQTAPAMPTDWWGPVYLPNFGGGTSTATRVSAFRVFYRLQVSPAPATATFPNDVPASHPAFRFVEALAAAGITGGCGAGSFCPDAPLTRSQMAVFLSVALGLHFQD